MPYSPAAFSDTSRGRLEVELFVADAPQTALNFIRLARAGFFAGTPFYDVVPNGHVAGGDPRGDGMGGPGYVIGSEINERPFVRGTLVLQEDEDRDYYAMFFGSNHDRNRFDFPQGKGPFEKVMTFLSCVANGGTEFDGVLTEALEKATTMFDATGKGKADIVFITDGLAHLSDEWINGFNAERDRVGVRVYSVYIGGASDMESRTGPIGLLNRISDAAIPIKELKPESVRRIFEKV